jgi:hypothetical protein
VQGLTNVAEIRVDIRTTVRGNLCKPKNPSGNIDIKETLIADSSLYLSCKGRVVRRASDIICDQLLQLVRSNGNIGIRRALPAFGRKNFAFSRTSAIEKAGLNG